MIPGEAESTPRRAGQKAERVNVETEVETAHGWLFMVAVAGESGQGSRHEVRLSHVDYEFWSHGMFSPSRVTQVVVEAILDGTAQGEVRAIGCVPRPLPPAFDASTGRRWVRGLDEHVRETL